MGCSLPELRSELPESADRVVAFLLEPGPFPLVVTEADDRFGDGGSGGISTVGTTLDDINVAGWGNSSPEAPDESLKNFFCGRFEAFAGGAIVTAVETVGFDGTSPVGV
jgi:hypothetical protein